MQGKPYHGGTAKDNIRKMPNKTKKEKVKYRLQSQHTSVNAYENTVYNNYSAAFAGVVFL